MLREMLNCGSDRKRRRIQVLLLSLLVSLVSCNKSEKPTTTAAAPETFATLNDAGAALLAAAKADDRGALLRIFGPGSADLIFSGDAAQDKLSYEHFATAYQTMNRWRNQTNGSQVLFVGADNNPFPIPLRKNSAAQWYFDTAAGKDEILARRVGENELAVIDIMAAMADAQSIYISQRHGGAKQYAQKFISNQGTQNGLYWESPQGQPRSPLGPLVVDASAERSTPDASKQQPFHGYFFRMLSQQGADADGGAKDYVVNGKMTEGFAFIAYPQKYGDTGNMTFIINQTGVVYHKDLGKSTIENAMAIKEFSPDKSWSPVPE